MRLEIVNQDNVFQVEGYLEGKNVVVFQKHFNDVLEKYSKLTIHIGKVSRIDRLGVRALEVLHHESLSKGINLSIVGEGSDDLYEEFGSCRSFGGSAI